MNRTGSFRKTSLIAALSAVLLLPVSALEAADDGQTIRLQSRQISPAEEAGKGSAVTEKAILAGRGSHLLVQLHAIPDAAQREALAKAGIHLLDYVPDMAWFARIERAVDLSKAPMSLVRWAGALEPSDRLSPTLRQSGVGKWARAENGTVTLQLSFFKGVDFDAVSALFKRHRIEYVSGQDHANLVVRVANAAAIQRLAGEDIIQWIDNGPAPRYPRDVDNGARAQHQQTPPLLAKNDGARDATRVNALQTTVPGANGSGTRLAVFDGGVDGAHPDFAGRITLDPNHSQAADQHGTHVAGTMAGDGSNSQSQAGTANQFRGIATAAQIFSYDNNTNSNNQDYFASHQAAIQTANADLSQNSWGGNFTSQNCDTHNVYSVDAQNMDKIVTGEAWGRGILVNVAASNFRQGTSDNQMETDPICNFAGAPDYINYTSLSDLGSAKNIISVGATQKVSTNRMADFSSWGPTRDGRLKPDIVAPGEAIRSTVPGGGYGELSGTSMATPHISGISALVIQRYRAVFNNQSPRPATVRAILIQTAQDLQADHVYYTPGPDFASGYGIADAEAAYNAVASGRVLERQAANAANDQLFIEIAANQPQLKVSLAWDDPAPTLNAATKLVNNLDLELVAPDGTTLHLPWVLNPNNPSAAATRGVDNLNNAEQVMVSNPAPGNWTLRVKGTAVPSGPQRYSLSSSHPMQAQPANPDTLFSNGFES